MDLISKRTRVEFREYFVGTTLGHIQQEFDVAGVPFDGAYEPPETGQRRRLVEQYYWAVDWASWRDVRKVLRVYESVLERLEDHLKHPPSGLSVEYTQRTLATLLRCIERDGFSYAEGRISSVAHASAAEEVRAIAAALDGTGLRRQLDRMREAVEEDPELAIGTAKELIETTCRTILPDYGVTPHPDWDVTRLVKETRAVLHLVPEDVPDSAKGADIIKRVLSNMGVIAQGLAELRNLYGTGHGKDHGAKGLAPRHARLAVNAAGTLATFLFEAHENRKGMR